MWKNSGHLSVPLLIGARISVIGFCLLEEADVPRLMPFGDSSLDAALPDVYLVHNTEGNAVRYAIMEVNCRVQSAGVYTNGRVWTVDYALERNPFRAKTVK